MDSFGNLPNMNAAEVAIRLPGVAGNPSDENLVNGFTIRGIGPGLNTVTLDGSPLTSEGSLTRSTNINNLTGFGLGSYTLFTYTPGLLTNNGLSVTPIGSLPGVFFGVDVSVAGIVTLLVNGTITQYWDGANTVPGVVEGGSGTWDAVSTNWTDSTGATNGTWNGIDAVFTAAQGTVTVSGTQDFASLYFQTDGYIVTGGTLNGAASSVLMADAGITTTIDSTLTGIGTVLDIDYAGSTLNLDGNSSFTGAVHLNGGTLNVGHDNALGLGGIVTMAAGTTLAATTVGLNMSHDFVLAGNATFDSGATGAPNGLNIIGTISGAGGLTKTGASKMLLTLDNTYSGDTNINAGTILINTNGAFSGGHVNLANNTGVSTNGADVALANDISLAAGNGFFTAVGSDVLTLDGLIDGLGGLNAAGSGTVVLTDATNSFSGDVFIDTGTLSISADGNLGDSANTVTVTNGGKLLFTGSFTSARDVDLGTGATIAVLGAAVLAAGWALWNSRAWGRGLAVFAQLLLLPVAWYMGVGSHQWGYAIPLAVVAAAILVLLFSPATLQWLSSPDDQSAASAESSAPDTR